MGLSFCARANVFSRLKYFGRNVPHWAKHLQLSCYFIVGGIGSMIFQSYSNICKIISLSVKSSFFLFQGSAPAYYRHPNMSDFFNSPIGSMKSSPCQERLYSWNRFFYETSSTYLKNKSISNFNDSARRCNDANEDHNSLRRCTNTNWLKVSSWVSCSVAK